MTGAQKRAVELLWFIYGNAGPQYTKGNHEFLRRKLEGHPEPEHYQPTEQCKKDFEKIMAGDYSPFPERVAKQLCKTEEKETHWREVAGQ